MTKTLKRFTFAAAVASMTMLFAGTALAETKEVTTTDGLVTITLPNEKWVQVPSDTNTEVFSDGDCAILFDVYRSDDELPGIVKVDEQHLVVYNSAAATKDYVFIATGLITAEEDYNDIRSAIDRIEVHQDKITDEMLVHTLNLDDFSIEAVSYTAWVSADELNVRDASSTEGAVLTTAHYGDQVEVTGVIKKNGADTGWSRIKINGLDGYVSSQFLSTTKPEDKPSANPNNAYPFTVYYPDGTPYTLYLDSEGCAHDDTNTEFIQGQDGVWRNDQYGVYFYNYNPNGGQGSNAYPFTVYYPDGTPYTLYLDSEGCAHDDTNAEFIQGQDGTWRNDQYGVYFYNYNPNQGQSSNDYSFTVYYPDGTPYTLYLDSEGYAHDATNTEFIQGQDGTWRNDQYGVEFYNHN